MKTVIEKKYINFSLIKYQKLSFGFWFANYKCLIDFDSVCLFMTKLENE